MQRFVGEVAIVTGAGNGIGKAAAQRLAGEGAAVAVADLDLAAAQGTVQEILAAGGQAIAVTVDVTSRASVEAMLATVLEHYAQVGLQWANRFSRLPMRIGSARWM
jgi:NAD(P)-dependent dehydrogenase (short-subunit alcohol dehydrogenase family)